jgi:hypothetical protein
MKPRMLNRITIVKLNNKPYDPNHYHAIVKDDEVTYHLPSFVKSFLSDEDGDYLIGIKGKLTEEAKENVAQIAESLYLPNPFGEDESLDIPTDFDSE